jgi:predicted nucleic acid-binding protein
MSLFVHIAPEVLASVVSLLEAHPLRAMDALHVACVLACEPDAFASADHRQLSAARKSGLRVVDVS